MEFVTFEIAKKLKEKGFNEECLCHYIGEDLIYNIESPIANNQLWFSHNKFNNIWHRDNIDAPTISQVLKWLREEKRLFIEINCNYTDYFPTIRKLDYHETDWVRGDIVYLTYEQAALAGIEYILDNLI